MDKSKRKFSIGCMITFWTVFFGVIILIIKGINELLDWWTGSSLLDPHSPMYQSRVFLSHNWFWILIGLIVVTVFFERVINGNSHHQGSAYH